MPVLTLDGEQFGILEHVLEVPEVDVFDGIVVWTGGGKLAGKYIEHELKAGSRAGAVPAEFVDVSGTLRFVDADQIAVITTRYIRCAFGREQVALLPPPSGAGSFRVGDLDAIGPRLHHLVGSLFGRSWARGN